MHTTGQFLLTFSGPFVSDLSSHTLPVGQTMKQTKGRTNSETNQVSSRTKGLHAPGKSTALDQYLSIETVAFLFFFAICDLVLL